MCESEAAATRFFMCESEAAANKACGSFLHFSYTLPRKYNSQESRGFLPLY
ncbi:hypothetical protein [Lysinibacillus xylanilyticus]|uniref:hypothetical protein n=1 Tax=Lysinibacillus xylanilyticus TaxID=582475 RepID=UPI003D08630E